MRIRSMVLAALLALGIIAPASAASADVCYDLDIQLNGSVVADEEGCIPV